MARNRIKGPRPRPRRSRKSPRQTAHRDPLVKYKPRPKKKTASALERAIELFRDQYGPSERLAMLIKEFEISEDTAYRWQREALERMNATEIPTSDRIIELREQTRVAFDDTYRAARKDRDHAAAVRAVAERAKIFGLQAPLEVRHGQSTEAGPVAVEVTAPILEKRTADLRAELVALTARARGLAQPDAAPAAPADTAPAAPSEEPAS